MDGKRKHIATGNQRGRPKGPAIAPPAMFLKPPTTKYVEPEWEVEITLTTPGSDGECARFSWYMTTRQLDIFKFDVVKGELGKINYKVYSLRSSLENAS